MFSTRALKLKTKKGGGGIVENLLAFPRFVAKAMLLVTSRQTNRCKQTKKGEA